METVILIFHLIIIVTMVLVILLQRNSNDGLSGLGGGSSNPATMGQTRGSANPLTKATSILATMFICTSLALAYLANAKNASVLDDVPVSDTKAADTSKVPLQLDEEEIKKALNEGTAPAKQAPLAVEDSTSKKVEDKAGAVNAEKTSEKAAPKADEEKSEKPAGVPVAE